MPEWIPASGSATPPVSTRGPLSAARRVVAAKRWKIVSSVGAIGLAALVAWGFLHHPGYDELIPGGTTPVATRVKVSGARQYSPKSSLYLVFVRERTDVNYWEYLRSKWFDDDAELTKIPKNQPAPPARESQCMMDTSQIAAKTVALSKLGYTIATKPGVQISSILAGGSPAEAVLRCLDTIRAINGAPTNSPDALRTEVRRNKPGDTVDVTFERDGARFTKKVKLIAGPDNVPLLGIGAQTVAEFPVELKIDTGEIGGPSAGLAMTLTLIDELTPGELTGGKRVVATGEIRDDGSVGEIGALELKAIAVRERRADLFLVPACEGDPVNDAKHIRECSAQIETAKKNARGVEVVPVRNLDEALRVLEQHGGTPISKVQALSGG